MNINSKEYWDTRFSTGDWEKHGGRSQTTSFALGQMPMLKIQSDFSGTILDFGCGLGDAIPVYHKYFPHAKLIGLDISESGIDICKKKYGNIADFIQGDYLSTPVADVIIASNVFEHLTNDIQIAKELLLRCSELYIIVPYKENIVPNGEHINSYDENHFNEIGHCACCIFSCKGWSQYGLDLFYHVYFKNIFRLMLAKQIIRRNKQILFHFPRHS